MIYGVCGVAGSGKTTVCTRISEELDIPFVRTSITEIAQRFGYNAVGNLSLLERIHLQKLLLKDHIQLIERIPRPAILDRTPIDMAGYMLAEFSMHSGKDLPMEALQAVAEYAHQCIRVAATLYDHIFLLGPLSVYEVADKRPPVNPAYQTHYDMLIRGVLAQCHMTYSILNGTDLETRVGHLHEVIVARLDHFDKERPASRRMN